MPGPGMRCTRQHRVGRRVASAAERRRARADPQPPCRRRSRGGIGKPNHPRTREDNAMGVAVQIEPSVKSFVGARVRPMLIDGKWVEAASGKSFETPNPATGEVLARVAEGDAEDIDRAARAARRAFDEGHWPRMAPAERERLLLKRSEERRVGKEWRCRSAATYAEE